MKDKIECLQKFILIIIILAEHGEISLSGERRMDGSERRMGCV